MRIQEPKMSTALTAIDYFKCDGLGRQIASSRERPDNDLGASQHILPTCRPSAWAPCLQQVAVQSVGFACNCERRPPTAAPCPDSCQNMALSSDAGSTKSPLKKSFFDLQMAVPMVLRSNGKPLTRTRAHLIFSIARHQNVLPQVSRYPVPDEWHCSRWRSSDR